MHVAHNNFSPVNVAGTSKKIEQAGCTIFQLYMNSCCPQRVELEVLTKVTSKADRWKQEHTQKFLKGGGGKFFKKKPDPILVT